MAEKVARRIGAYALKTWLDLMEQTAETIAWCTKSAQTGGRPGRHAQTWIGAPSSVGALIRWTCSGSVAFVAPIQILQGFDNLSLTNHVIFFSSCTNKYFVPTILLMYVPRYIYVRIYIMKLYKSNVANLGLVQLLESLHAGGNFLLEVFHPAVGWMLTNSNSCRQIGVGWKHSLDTHDSIWIPNLPGSRNGTYAHRIIVKNYLQLQHFGSSACVQEACPLGIYRGASCGTVCRKGSCRTVTRKQNVTVELPRSAMWHHLELLVELLALWQMCSAPGSRTRKALEIPWNAISTCFGTISRRNCLCLWCFASIYKTSTSPHASLGFSASAKVQLYNMNCVAAKWFDKQTIR